MKKLNLLKEIIANKFPIINNNDPLFKLITNIEEIKIIFNDYKYCSKEIFYYNREKIHLLLYENEKFIYLNKEDYINPNNNNINLGELFYLSLLIDNKDMINYKYPFEFISFIYNNYLKKCDTETEKFRIIILAKIILTLISNFENDEENQYEKKIDEMKNDIKDIIENNLNVFKGLNINLSCEDICSEIIHIDTIYNEIIISLIKENKLFDYNYCFDIIRQLNLENINITSTILKGLSEQLNKENKKIENYAINGFKDLINENKINFYYLLCKFILKNDIYIYQFDFLLENFKRFKNLLKQKISFQINPNIIRKISELIKFLNLPDIYYYNNINFFNFYKEKSKQENGSLISYKSNYFESLENYKINNNSKSYTSLEPFNTNSNLSITSNLTIAKSLIDNNIIENILNELKFIITISPKKEVTYEKISCPNYKNIDIEYLQGNNISKILENDNELYRNYKKLLFFFGEIENIISISPIKLRPRIKCEIKREKEDFKGLLYNMTFFARFKNNNKNQRFKDENILENGIDSKSQGFLYLINELCNDDYNDNNNEFLPLLIDESSSDYSENNDEEEEDYI